MVFKRETIRDSGWAWVVAAGMSTSFLIIAGFFRGFGVFYASLVEEFGGSASATSLIQGFRFAALCVVAPIASWLCERFTERAVLFIGAAAFSSALILSYFAPNLEFNVLTLGAMTGVGMACILTPAQIAIGKYFDKYRSLANSICFCGSSLGMMSVPPVIIYLIEQYGLRGSLLIYGGFLLNCFACAALVRPIMNGRSASIDISSDISIQNVNDVAGVSESATDDTSGAVSPDGGDKSQEEHQSQNTSPNGDNLADVNNTHMALKEETLLESYSFKNNDCVNGVLLDTPINDGSSLHSRSSNLFPELRRKNGSFSENVNSSANDTKMYSSGDVSHPNGMYSSYAHLQCVDGSMYLSVDPIHTKEPDVDTLQNYGSKKNTCLSVAKGVLDFSLFRNARFMIFLLSTSFAMVSFANVTIYIIPRAEEYGISRQKASLFLTIAGGCDIIGRLILGLISDIRKIGPHRVMMVSLFFMGVATILLPLAKDFNMMVVYAVVFGLIGSSGNLLCLPITVLFLGTERMPRAMGLVTSCHGIASALSPPILGYIKDTTGTYDSTFYVCGACQLIASGLMLLEPIARRYDMRHAAKLTSHLKK